MITTLHPIPHYVVQGTMHASYLLDTCHHITKVDSFVSVHFKRRTTANYFLI